LLAGVQSASRRVHEQFATWCSTAMLNLTREELVEQLPGYVGYYDDVERMVAAAPSVYLRSHLVHAIHRAAMQTDILDFVATHGLQTFRLSDLERTRRPDWRVSRIRASAESCAAALTADVEERGHRDERWPRLQAVSLSESLFAAELVAEHNDFKFHQPPDPATPREPIPLCCARSTLRTPPGYPQRPGRSGRPADSACRSAQPPISCHAGRQRESMITSAWPGS
jgi:hypothetical protein